MAFTESTKDAAFARSGGQCECERTTHGHVGRCPTKVTGHGAQYHHKVAADSGGDDSLSNCEVLDTDCHQKTQTYGG